jgi:hypothetical protein
VRTERVGELLDQLKRLQDLYVLGDLTKPSTSCAAKHWRKKYNASHHQPSPPSTKPTRSSTTCFWDLETNPAERRKLLLSLFKQVRAQEGQIVAVQPHDTFLPYFQAAQQNNRVVAPRADGESAAISDVAERAAIQHAREKLEAIGP